MQCLVKGCPNHDATDKVGEYLCPQCFILLTSGLIGTGNTFIHDLRDELLIAMAAQGIDGSDAVKPSKD
jgi:hypothetical protein